MVILAPFFPAGKTGGINFASGGGRACETGSWGAVKSGKQAGMKGSKLCHSIAKIGLPCYHSSNSCL